MRVWFPILSAALLASCATRTGIISGIADDRQAILVKIPAETAGFLPTWVPTRQQTDECLVAIQTFLEKEGAGPNAGWKSDLIAAEPSRKLPYEQRRKIEIQKILSGAIVWRVQFWGLTILGEKAPEKRICCNFFPAQGEWADEFSDWRKTPAEVDDGGFNFWRILYDPATKTCDLSVNGYAQNGVRYPNDQPALAVSSP
jgi:hypothetical protein